MTAAPTLPGTRVVLVPVTAEHVPELRRILSTPEVRARWRDEGASPGWPFDDLSAARFAVLLEQAVRGMAQYSEEDDPDYRHASIDVFLDPVVHGRGVGRDAVATLARYLAYERSHHRLVIDPAADNEPAIRCYAAVGFRPVGILRRYERDADGAGWHAGLLMTSSPRNSTSLTDHSPCRAPAAGPPCFGSRLSTATGCRPRRSRPGLRLWRR